MSACLTGRAYGYPSVCSLVCPPGRFDPRVGGPLPGGQGCWRPVRPQERVQPRNRELWLAAQLCRMSRRYRRGRSDQGSIGERPVTTTTRATPRAADRNLHSSRTAGAGRSRGRGGCPAGEWCGSPHASGVSSRRTFTARTAVAQVGSPRTWLCQVAGCRRAGRRRPDGRSRQGIRAGPAWSPVSPAGAGAAHCRHLSGGRVSRAGGPGRRFARAPCRRGGCVRRSVIGSLLLRQGSSRDDRCA